MCGHLPHYMGGIRPCVGISLTIWEVLIIETMCGHLPHYMGGIRPCVGISLTIWEVLIIETMCGHLPHYMGGIDYRDHVWASPSLYGRY